MGGKTPDVRSGILLNKLNELCNGGGFRIVEEGELLSCFTGKYGADGEDVRTMLEFLRESGYVDVQYAEEGVYCIRPLPEGRRYAERQKEERCEEERSRRLLALWSAVGAFSGALLGGTIVLLISLFL